jgi:hypothetical protein
LKVEYQDTTRAHIIFANLAPRFIVYIVKTWNKFLSHFRKTPKQDIPKDIPQDTPQKDPREIPNMAADKTIIFVTGELTSYGLYGWLGSLTADLYLRCQ